MREFVLQKFSIHFFWCLFQVLSCRAKVIQGTRSGLRTWSAMLGLRGNLLSPHAKISPASRQQARLVQARRLASGRHGEWRQQMIHATVTREAKAGRSFLLKPPATGQAGGPRGNAGRHWPILFGSLAGDIKAKLVETASVRRTVSLAPSVRPAIT